MHAIIPHAADPETAPFVIEHERRNLLPDGRFSPAARLVLTPALRTSGLLAALPPEELKTLLFLLTFLTPNGRIAPAAPQVADAMRVNARKAADRLRRLEAFRWNGAPVAFRSDAGGGIATAGTVTTVTPSPALLAVRDSPSAVPSEPVPPQPPPGTGEAARAFSRARYGRPRAAVERFVARQLSAAYGGPDRLRGSGSGDGSDGDDGGPGAEMRRKLLDHGVPPATAARLAASYPAERIERQLDYIDDRAARDPARLLAAAIEGDYGPPLRRRLRERAAGPAPIRDAGEQDGRTEHGER